MIGLGSPPRMRGKASSRPPLPPLWRDHPRVCGEKMAGYWGQKESYGSPPRMRGKVPVLDSLTVWRRDHPRVCGEKRQAGQRLGSAMGSPPRMRGKVDYASRNGMVERITPAYAGKSRVALQCRIYGRDHPRVCGEKDLSKNFILPELGSPPHMRGKGIKPCYQRVTVGITPAYAGKRSLLSFLIAS